MWDIVHDLLIYFAWKVELLNDSFHVDWRSFFFSNEPADLCKKLANYKATKQNHPNKTAQKEKEQHARHYAKWY